MKTIGTYILHFLIVSLVLLLIAVVFGISQHASLNYGTDSSANKVAGEGPFIFYSNSQLESNYIRGSRESGFSVEKQAYAPEQVIPATVTYNGDQSSFDFDIHPAIITPKAVYDDQQSILALSDLEGNFQAFRDFLITHQVISEELEWTFGQGHLVLVGDMVDRGSSTTQLLWLIYKLEQEARKAGGQLHYIIGNHEIKNLQGNFKSAADKYLPIAGIMGKTQADLFSNNSFIGRWLESKNVMEIINGTIFVHGGIDPQLMQFDWTVEDINEQVRAYYRQMYYPGLADKNTELLISTQSGPAWYRGYFKDKVNEEQFQATINKFGAKAVVVGHTLQFSVNSQFDGKLFAIDVKHPSDYSNSFPTKHSEGLLIENGIYYRLLDDGQKIPLS
ncbi:metallophosphoesterase [Kangiella sp.]|uniref:metallophosphoesterase n=1 Tax=Kangiella sp. TaxID=1920245 RepID=UPI003A8CC3E0